MEFKKIIEYGPDHVAEDEDYKLVDIKSALKSPKHLLLYKLLGRPLEALIGVKILNENYTPISRKCKGDVICFIDETCKRIGITYDIKDEEIIKKYRDIEGPLIFVANHPFGGIESFPFIRFLSQVRPDYQVIANFLLYRFRELQKVILPVDPYENEEAIRRNIRQIKKIIDYLKKGNLMGVFPAGEVSSLKLKDWKIRDKEWSESISNIILKTKTTVVPVYFHGRNSILFQIVGLMNPYIRSAFLPRELIKPTVKHIHFELGEPIYHESVSHFTDPKEFAAFLHAETYKLQPILKKRLGK
jgi:putative hemolysin